MDIVGQEGSIVSIFYGVLCLFPVWNRSIELNTSSEFRLIVNFVGKFFPQLKFPMSGSMTSVIDVKISLECCCLLSVTLQEC